MLLDATAADGATALGLAVRGAHADAAAALIERGANVGAADAVGRSPLYEAVKRGDVATATALLGRGAPADARISPAAGGLVPLHLAAKHGRPDLVRLLANAGGAVRPLSREGRGGARTLEILYASLVVRWPSVFGSLGARLRVGLISPHLTHRA